MLTPNSIELRSKPPPLRAKSAHHGNPTRAPSVGRLGMRRKPFRRSRWTCELYTTGTHGPPYLDHDDLRLTRKYRIGARNMSQIVRLVEIYRPRSVARPVATSKCPNPSTA